MKMTSGKRKQERQGRSLDRLLVMAPPNRIGEIEDDKARHTALAQWEERAKVEIETLKKRTGRF